MQAHFQDALLIRQAVIAGTPERTGAPAQVLTETYTLDELPKGWKPFVEQMQQAARRITDSASSAQAAAATADLGLSCGACHSDRGGPKPSSEPLPADGGSVRDRMKRHVWATERLWEGIYVPSADAWSAGARALSTEPFPGEILKSGGVHARSAAGDFKKLAATAPAKTSPRERAALYAEMLVTCGACHQATRNSGK
jgi:mono/diheme cytochrome c family protein